MNLPVAHLARHPEHGAVGLFVLFAGLMLSGLLCTLILAVTDVSIAAARARTAADAAALAAAAASPLVGGDDQPAAAAAALAAANGARLDGVGLAGWPVEVHVEVIAEPSTPLLAELGGAVRASATAEVRPGPRS